MFYVKDVIVDQINTNEWWLKFNMGECHRLELHNLFTYVQSYTGHL